jgi:ubiquinone/menaquinone biosynthesis C-methylase UbiE
MARSAAYDEIADCTCLEIGCGTGIHAATLRGRGWQPLGADISAGMLRYARNRLPVVRADVELLPFRERFVSGGGRRHDAHGGGFADRRKP